MTLLFRIIRAAHAKGTHHKLALDALTQLQDANAERWQRLFLKHAERYLTGSKAPDDEFKDFKNHVLHVRDGYWGGAPAKAESWYGQLVAALRSENWSDAAWAAGVLSHYYTDPIQPFHTGQSEAENAIHRAAEWSISKSYDDLRSQGEAAHPGLAVALPDGDGWLREQVCRGAEKANQHYEALISHYDLHKGVVDPPAGLDVLSRNILAELLIYAATGFAAVLDRAFAEAAVIPPEVELTAETVLAAVQIPAKVLAKRMANAEERRLVERMYDELQSTGRVEHTLSEDDRTVRDLHAREVLEPQRARTAAARAAAVSGVPTPPVPTSAAAEVAIAGAGQSAAPAATGTDRGRTLPTPRRAQQSLRARLAPTDDVERAPSIGPKLAERLYGCNIRTVADLLGADPTALSILLAHRHVTAQTLTDWQDQARLVIEVPGLRGGHAQLLTGAGYRTREAVASADQLELCARILTYAASPGGQRVLRESDAPDEAVIGGWIEAASNAREAA